jgi:hypothetical protein
MSGQRQTAVEEALRAEETVAEEAAHVRADWSCPLAGGWWVTEEDAVGRAAESGAGVGHCWGRALLGQARSWGPAIAGSRRWGREGW